MTKITKPAAWTLTASFLMALLFTGSAVQAAPADRARKIEAPGGTAIPREALTRIVDSVFASGMAAENIPGGVFIMVQRGRVVLAKGYGVANLATRQRVSPDSTLWRIGSISKVMTALGVVQLADRGRIRLSTDVNQYLRRLKVPATYDEPVTPWHLLTHTGGLDELPGRSAASREDVLPLHVFLRDRMVRVRKPGSVVAYSSYGPALAGALIEDVSNLDYETYLTRNVWGPLGMHHTNVHPTDGMPRGYGVAGGNVVEAPWEWSHTAPAGMINSTAGDMGRFMNMMLGYHPDGSKVLSDAARTSMLSRQIGMHPRVPGMGLGFFEERVHGRTIFQHGGDIAGYATLLVLLPDEATGFFIATHREGAQLRNTVRRQLLDQFFARPSGAPVALAAAAQPAVPTELSKFAGEYRWNIFCRTCPNPVWMPGVARVTVNADSTLSFSNRTWVPVEPLLFQSTDGRSLLAFTADATGAVKQLTTGGIAVLERISP
jgi:CubicO group peptidase (beta-lactamase class C family)